MAGAPIHVPEEEHDVTSVTTSSTGGSANQVPRKLEAGSAATGKLKAGSAVTGSSAATGNVAAVSAQQQMRKHEELFNRCELVSPAPTTEKNGTSNGEREVNTHTPLTLAIIQEEGGRVSRGGGGGGLGGDLIISP